MRHPYTEALFASIPRFDQDRTQALYSIPGVPPDLMTPPPGCRFAPRCRNAQARCTQEEPLLAPETSDGSRPGAGVGTPRRRRCRVRPAPASTSSPASTRSRPSAAEDRAAVDRSSPTRRAGASPVVEAAASGDAAALRLDNLVKEFPVTAGAVLQRKVGTVNAVSDVSFDVRRGETFGLVGESGCGKTTIGRLVVGARAADLGRGPLRRPGHRDAPRRRAAPARRDLQLMFQDPYASLDPRMRVGPSIKEPLDIQQVGSRAERQKRVAELLDEVGLSPKSAGLYPHEFSGGQRQRIGLARALALNPKLIVADEPVSALDVSIQAQILNLMREPAGRARADVHRHLARPRGRPLPRRHDRRHVPRQARRDRARPTTSTSGPAHPYTRGLIDAVPIPDPVLEKQRDTVPVRGELPSPIDPPSGCRFRTRCPLAQDICAEVEPPLRSFGGGHRAACHFPLQVPAEELRSSAGRTG